MKNLSYFRLTRREFDAFVDEMFVLSSGISSDVMVQYKDELYKAIQQVEDDVLNNVTSISELKDNMFSYLDNVKNSKLFNDSSFVVVNVPIILPFKFASILVFMRSLSVYTFMRLIDNTISNGMEGLKAITKTIFDDKDNSSLSLDDSTITASIKSKDIN